MSFVDKKKDLLFGQAASIKDQYCVDFLNKIDINLEGVLYDTQIVDEFCHNYYDWIKNSNNHIVNGLNDFKYIAYSNGTTESFDKFYIKNKDRRFRCLKGEYMYHQLAWRNSFNNWKYIEDEPLTSNDAVVISLPFSDTGNKHISYDSILDQCDILNIPVLVDLAYFSSAIGLTIDLSHSSITDLTFSLSKTFPVAHARIGIRLSKVDDDDTLFVYKKSNYANRLGAYIGNEFVKNFTSDYIVNKYKNKQLLFCNDLNIEPSATVFLGIDHNNKYPEYNRNGPTNRLSLHRQLVLTYDEFKNLL